MPKYRVSLMRIDELTIEVEADDESDAIGLAFDGAPGLCAHCSGWGQRWGVDEGEWAMASEFNPDNTDVELLDE